MGTPITLVHLGRRSTYFRQIGRNGVGFSIDRTGNPHHRRRNPPRRVFFLLGPRRPRATHAPLLDPLTVQALLFIRLHKWNMLHERPRYIIDFSSRILIGMKKCNNVFFFFYKLHFIVYDNKIFKYFSYHNVDIYLFPIFLVTNKKKIFEETNSNTKKISNYGIKLRSNLSRDDWCFSPDRYKDISHFANL